MKERLKKIARKLAPKNNPVTREISRGLPWLALGIMLGGIFIVQIIGQTTVIQGVVTVDNSSFMSNVPGGDDRYRISGTIEAWGALREHTGEELQLGVVVLQAQAIKYEDSENGFMPPTDY